MEPQTPRVVRAEDGIPWFHREAPQGRDDFLSLLQPHMLGPRAGVSVTSSINSLHRGRLCEPELLSLQATESSLRRPRRTGKCGVTHLGATHLGVTRAHAGGAQEQPGPGAAGSSLCAPRFRLSVPACPRHPLRPAPSVCHQDCPGSSGRN